jgi:hypothetical protein
MLRKKLFLASSSELKEDRKEFAIFINDKNKDWVGKGVFLELIVWEDFLDAVSKTRLQDEYNKAIRESDIFVMLFFTKVGQYTEEEFETAFKQFKATNKPFVFTYFKDAEISTGNANKKDLMSLWAFQEKLGVLGHFYTVYKSIDELKYKFNQQLDKLAATGFIELTWDRGEAPAPSGPTYQATLTGSGAIAQGQGAAAVGAGGIAVGGDYVGRDRITQGDQITTGDVSGTGIAIGRRAYAAATQDISPRDLESLFGSLLAVVGQEAAADKRAAAVQKVQELRAEVAKGKGDDGKIAQIVDGLAGMVPGAVQAVVSAFATPILGGVAGPVTRYVLERLKGSG